MVKVNPSSKGDSRFREISCRGGRYLNNRFNASLMKNDCRYSERKEHKISKENNVEVSVRLSRKWL